MVTPRGIGLIALCAGTLSGWGCATEHGSKGSPQLDPGTWRAASDEMVIVIDQEGDAEIADNVCGLLLGGIDLVVDADGFLELDAVGEDSDAVLLVLNDDRGTAQAPSLQLEFILTGQLFDDVLYIQLELYDENGSLACSSKQQLKLGTDEGLIESVITAR